MKILLAIDGSVCTKHMLAYMAAHDELLGAGHAYTALTVVEPMPTYAVDVVPDAMVASFCESEVRSILDPVRKFAAQQGWDFETRHVVGRPGETIAREAVDGKFDLVIMGTHGRTVAEGILLGSVAQRVLARCHVPVLLVH